MTTFNYARHILVCEPALSVSRDELDRDSATHYRHFSWCESAADAEALLLRTRFDAALVDVTTDEGMALLELLVRQQDLPILIVASADDLARRLRCLDLGAMDYLTRPYRIDELNTRLETLLARFGKMDLRPVMRCGQMLLDRHASRIGDGRRWTLLTPRECETLSLFVQHRNRPLTRERIREAIQGNEDVTDNAIEVLLCRLRGKLRPLGLEIRSQRGVGYNIAQVPVGRGGRSRIAPVRARLAA